MLSDVQADVADGSGSCLNAPSGAGCFLTFEAYGWWRVDIDVLMHLVVLGAF